jgi:hypothetical protein
MDELLFILSLSNNSIFNHNPFSVRKIYWSWFLPGGREETQIGMVVAAVDELFSKMLAVVITRQQVDVAAAGCWLLAAASCEPLLVQLASA